MELLLDVVRDDETEEDELEDDRDELEDVDETVELCGKDDVRRVPRVQVPKPGLPAKSKSLYSIQWGSREHVR